MIAYKFKSLQNFDHIADIFLKERFYAARFDELNDPMDGFIRYQAEIEKQQIDEMEKAIREKRLCCFSKSRSDILLWAHYADGFRGICIETNIRDKSYFININYDFPIQTLRPENLQGNKSALVELYCRRKMKPWSYEKEVRIFSGNNRFIDQVWLEIKAVYLGLRISTVLKEALLRIVPEKIKVFETGISEKTGEVVATQQIKWDQLTATECRVECNES